jgi:hypothetical protein
LVVKTLLAEAVAHWRMSLAYEVYVVGDVDSSWPEMVVGPVDVDDRWPGLSVRRVGSFASEEQAFGVLEDLLVGSGSPAGRER